MIRSSLNHNVKEVLASLSSYVGLIKNVGIDTRIFYYNRSRLFLSITSSSESKARRSSSIIILFFVVSLVRLIKGIFQSVRIPKILIVDTREYYGSVLKAQGNTIDNVILGNLYDEVDWKTIGLLDRFSPPFDDSRFKSSWKSYSKNILNRPRFYEEVILFRYLLLNPLSWWKNSRSNGKKFKDLEYVKVDNETFNSIHQQLQDYEKSTRFFSWKEEAYYWFFRRTKVKKILLLDEYSPNQRCILNAASRSNIECVALQHGGIHDLHPGYVYGSEDVSSNIFPDKFLTWGSSYTEFLEKHNWKIPIYEVGHLRTDMIAHLRETSQVSEKVVMFASQPHKDEAYLEKVAKLVFEAFNALEVEVKTILRPHPREQNLEKYKKWAEEIGLHNLLIEANEDLYLSLAKTDVVITAFSTVGQEAVYFNKPLITVDYLERDIASYVRENVATNVTDSEGLVTAIMDKLGRSGIDQNAYKEYINRYAHMIDGKVSDRILEILLSEE